jgi:hypothetical protein
MAPLTCPVCAAPVRQGDLICINCGANLARREPQPQYPAQQDQQPGQYPPQEQSPYPPQQGYQQQDQQGYQQQDQQGYQQQQQYPPQQDYPQQYGQPQQGQSPYPPQQPQYPQHDPQQQYPPQDPQQQQYPPQDPQRSSPYPPAQDQYAPPQQGDRQQYAPPPQQGYPPQQYPPQQQGYGGGYGSPGAPHIPPPPREPTMTGGESTAAFTPFCPHCGAEIPDVGNPVCVQCLRPLHDQGGGGAPQQLSMFVQFSSGELQVTAGQELVLGRDPVHSPVAGTFSRFDNVSRRHATLGIDGGGQAWVRDERSTNGTFVNDRRLQPGEQTSLRDGDSVRLAADARGQVRLGR